MRSGSSSNERKVHASGNEDIYHCKDIHVPVSLQFFRMIRNLCCTTSTLFGDACLFACPYRANKVTSSFLHAPRTFPYLLPKCTEVCKIIVARYFHVRFFHTPAIHSIKFLIGSNGMEHIDVGYSKPSAIQLGVNHHQYCPNPGTRASM